MAKKREHVLCFDLDAHYPGREALEDLGKRWGLRHAKAVVEQVFEAVSDWKEAFARIGVSEGDIFQFREIDSRVQGGLTSCRSSFGKEIYLNRNH